MKTIKNILVLILTTTVLGCASSKNMDKNLPLEIGDVYYQESIEGKAKGSSSITVFIPVISNVNQLKLDSIYFRGQQSSLKFMDNGYIGTFTHLDDQKTDIIMSNAPYAEYGNKAPQLPPKRAIGLSYSEALVSYNDGNKTNYFKISNISKKQL